MQNIDAPLMRKVITIITLIKLRIVFMSCSKPDPQQNRQTVFFMKPCVHQDLITLRERLTKSASSLSLIQNNNS